MCPQETVVWDQIRDMVGTGFPGWQGKDVSKESSFPGLRQSPHSSKGASKGACFFAWGRLSCQAVEVPAGEGTTEGASPGEGISGGPSLGVSGPTGPGQTHRPAATVVISPKAGRVINPPLRGLQDCHSPQVGTGHRPPFPYNADNPKSE